jgi:hypothetical protein
MNDHITPSAAGWTGRERVEIDRLQTLCDRSQEWELDSGHPDVGDPLVHHLRPAGSTGRRSFGSHRPPICGRLAARWEVRQQGTVNSRREHPPRTRPRSLIERSSETSISIPEPRNFRIPAEDFAIDAMPGRCVHGNGCGVVSADDWLGTCARHSCPGVNGLRSSSATEVADVQNVPGLRADFRQKRQKLAGSDSVGRQTHIDDNAFCERRVSVGRSEKGCRRILGPSTIGACAKASPNVRFQRRS